MPHPTRARSLAMAVLAGTTVVTGALCTATPALAVPVAVEEHLAGAPGDTPPTGAEGYFTPVTLTNGDTAYGIHESQPLVPLGELLLDDEDYAVAEPFDDPATGWVDVVGEKVGEIPVYWEPENAALAGYILSVHGSTADPDEALAVHWAVRSLSTATAPRPAGLEQPHLERAAFLVQDARNNAPPVTPQDSYRTSVSFDPDGRPDTLLVQMPEAYYATTVTLSGPVTFADGTTTRTFTGGDPDKYLDLAVPAGVTTGEVTADLTATMPSPELTVLADEKYRDLLIAGQERTVDWGASAAFEIVAPPLPDEEGDDKGVDDEETTPPEDGGAPSAPVDQDTGNGNDNDTDTDTDTADDNDNDNDTDTDTNSDTPADDDQNGDHGTGSGDSAIGQDAEQPVRDRSAGVGAVLTDTAAEQTLTATLEAFVLFEDQTATSTEIVTETTMTSGGAEYADPAMANTGMGAAPAAGERSAFTSAVLAVIAVGAGLGAWTLRRRPPATPDRSA